MPFSRIEWTDQSWNPITGCSPASEGCENCYARRMTEIFRKKGVTSYRNGFGVSFHPERLNEPGRVKKPSVFFVCSMGDFFHEKVKREWQETVLNTIRSLPRHFFLFLTKRPENAQANADWMAPYFALSNVWLGVTIESMQHVIRIMSPFEHWRKGEPYIPIRFISHEPLLEAIRTTIIVSDDFAQAMSDYLLQHPLRWIITGGETGQDARVCDPRWIAEIHAHSRRKGIPFFFKKWGANTKEDCLSQGLRDEIENCRQFPSEILQILEAGTKPQKKEPEMSLF